MERFFRKRERGAPAAPGRAGPRCGNCELRQTRIWAKMSGAVLVLAFSSTGAFAQSTEAARYVNGQGIEVIQARQAATSGQDAAKRETQKPTADAAKSILHSSPAPAVLDSMFLIPAKAQATRDRDRRAILQEELKEETAAFESKLKILQDPAVNSKLGPEDRRRLDEAMIRHEKNIRALNAEIGHIGRQS